ncbi:hypothetical protein K490DRAFT_58049 [Saccharata proteae CBS 121410]|uniref:Voltage-gated hydrogen channel 1 n=1 Tax=Saccharata proteae CBS 121410 TaxID=1314787 RepID=A0A9P4HST6_9PEZI|nr:hypothetical protein K490DRAFT_58049 [Saccharata proteae CBS 121410]
MDDSNDSNDSNEPLLRSRRTLSEFTNRSLHRIYSESPESTMHVSRQKTQRFLSSKTGHYAVLVLVSLDVSCIFADFIVNLLTCEKRLPKQPWNDVLEGLGIVSLVFSCLFMLELLASVWAFGFSYFKAKFHCVDACVIIASFVIDVLLRGIVEEVASLVIVLRLWRVVKILEELATGASEQMEDLEERIESLEKENQELKDEVSRLKES